MFKNASLIDEDEKQIRVAKIKSTIQSINKINQKLFEDRLKKYYN